MYYRFIDYVYYKLYNTLHYLRILTLYKNLLKCIITTPCYKPTYRFGASPFIRDPTSPQLLRAGPSCVIRAIRRSAMDFSFSEQVDRLLAQLKVGKRTGVRSVQRVFGSWNPFHSHSIFSDLLRFIYVIYLICMICIFVREIYIHQYIHIVDIHQSWSQVDNIVMVNVITDTIQWTIDMSINLRQQHY